MKKIRVLIPDSESGHSLIVIRCLSEVPDIEIHVMARTQNAASKYSRFIKSFEHISNNQEDYLEKILNQAKKKNIDLILPVDEPAHRIFANNLELVHRYCRTTPIPTPGIFETAVNKWKLGQFCEAHNIPFPKSYYIEKTEDLNELQNLTYPLIIKPESGHGGNNISVLQSYNELESFIGSKPDRSMGNYILQDFIEGYDIDMSLLAKDGEILAYTIQKGFLRRSNIFAASAGIEFLYEEELFKSVKKLIANLNYSGIAHLDLRYDAIQKNIKLIEINARYWGSLTGSLLAGVNFPYLACMAGMGQDFDVPTYEFVRYIDHSAAVKSLFRKPFARYPRRIKYSETDLKYILRDPIAESINIIQRKRPHVKKSSG